MTRRLREQEFMCPRWRARSCWTRVKARLQGTDWDSGMAAAAQQGQVGRDALTERGAWRALRRIPWCQEMGKRRPWVSGPALTAAEEWRLGVPVTMSGRQNGSLQYACLVPHPLSPRQLPCALTHWDTCVPTCLHVLVLCWV